jgi:acyl-CoA reductase-like NAD-dependent aldehyde dehydrogenase
MVEVTDGIIAHLGITPEDFVLYRRESPLSSNDVIISTHARKNDVQKAFKVACDSLSELRSISLMQRIKVVRNAAALLKDNLEELAQIVRLETGKPISMSRQECQVAIDFMNSISGSITFDIGTVIPSSTNKLAFTRIVPKGIAGLIVSFNTPVPNYAWKLIPSYLAGNASILKPSPYTPKSALYFAHQLLASGAHPGSIFVIQGDGTTGSLINKLPVDLMSFTGSSSTAEKIVFEGTNFTRKLIMELGGNNPLIVCEDARLDSAVQACIQAAFSNSGQRCASGSRIYLQKQIADQFKDKLYSELSTLKIGINPDVFMGPLIDSSAVDNYQDYVSQVNSKADKVFKFGQVNGAADWLVPMTVIEFSELDNPLIHEEVFAPILRIAIFENDDEVIASVNKSKYGLTAAVWTESFRRFFTFADSISSGVCNMNGPTHGSEFQFPFGGTKSSGNGLKEVGENCVETYGETQFISLDRSI